MKKLILTLQNSKNRGYTLLFAVLVASLVLAIGISILNISKKEFLLSSSARDSSVALYAADGGTECAAYGDQKHDVFSTSTDNRGLLKCGDAMGSISVDDMNAPAPIFTFSVKFGDVGASCANVSVKKEYIAGSLVTTIDSRGYNLGWLDPNGPCSVQSPKKVERGLRLSY